MAKRSRRKKDDIVAYRYEKNKRKNVVPVGLASYNTSIDEDKFELLTSTHSLPFKLGPEKRIAVKVIDHRGNEVLVVREVG